MTSYDVIWIPGMGDGLAQKIAYLLTHRAENGWKPNQVILGPSGAIFGAMVILEKPGA